MALDQPSAVTGQHILVADSDPISQRLLQAIYRDSDYHLHFCVSGREVEEAIARETVDLLITEVLLPDENGFELRKKLRLLHDELPIIFISSVGDIGGRSLLENISNDPNTFFLRKPIYRNAILELTQRILHDQGERREQRRHMELLEGDIAMASTMQKLMLPDWVSLYPDGFLMISNYIAHEHLSGDYFVLETLPNGNYFLVIGDISGHGIRAALHMSVIQSVTTFFIKTYHGDSIICDYLNTLNVQICNHFQSVFYLTCLVAVINPESGMVRYLTAGHPDFFLKKRNQDHLEYLGDREHRSIPVGWLATTRYRPEQVVRRQLNPDEQLLAVTDGVIERRHFNGKMLGIEGLTGMRIDPRPASILPFTIAAALDDAGFSEVEDDMVLLSFGFLPRQEGCKKELYRTLPPDMSRAAAVAEEAAEVVRELLHDRPLSFKVELTIGEFLNNIILHGLEGELKMKPQILFHMAIRPMRIELTFLDQGKEWHYVPTHRGLSPAEAEYFLLAQAGRGMRILEQLTDRIIRTRVNNINVTRLLLSTQVKE